MTGSSPSPVLLAALLCGPAVAQELAPGASLPRKIEYLAPEDTFLLVRARRLAVDVRGLLDLANRLVGDRGPLATLLPDRQRDQVRAGLRLVRGVERNAIGAALEELGRGELAFGLRVEAGGRPLPFLLARLSDEAAARRVMRPLRGIFRLPVERRGVLLLLAGDPRTKTAVGKNVLRVLRGEGPTRTGVRIAAEMGDAPLTGWVDLRDTVPGRLLRAGLRKAPRNPGAAFLAGGLGPTLAAASSLVMEARLSWRDVRLELRAPDIRGKVPAWARAILGLDQEPLPEPPEVPGTLARIRLSRSLAAFLAHREEAAAKGAQDGIQSFLAGMELVFRGARVEEDIFPQMRPGLLGAVTLPRPEAAARPELPFRLPAGAFVVGIAEKGRLARSLEGAMQVLLIVTNNERRRKGKLQFRLKGKKREGRRTLYTVPVPPAGGRPWSTDAAFAPALARAGEWVAIGVSRELCGELIDGLVNAPAAGPDSRARGLDLLDLRFESIAAAIRMNRALIEARLLVDRGFDQSHAAPWVEALANVVAMAGRATLATGFEGKDWLVSLRWQPKLSAQEAGR